MDASADDHGVQIGDLLRDAAERAIAYLDGLDGRDVRPSGDALAGLDVLREPLPDTPTGAAEVLELLDRVGSPATMAVSGARFFGWVIGGAVPASRAASWLATAWDQNAALEAMAPGAAALEEVAATWMVDLLGLPPGTATGFVTGATMANAACLTAARRAVLESAGWDPDADGLFGAPPVTVVLGEEAHPSINRSLALLGFGRERVVRAPVDDQGRIRPEALPEVKGPAIVCVQVGNVNTGACDPVSDVVERVRGEGVWVHVDGAFGLWARATPSRAHLVAGVEDADSWATDAHKWLNVPYDSGLAFVRRPEALLGALSLQAAYLPEGGQRDPSGLTPELSRRARGVEVWAALRSLGRSGLEEMIERTSRHAARFADGLRDAGYEILNDVVLNQVLVAFGDDDVTRRVIAAVQDDGTCWAGPTEWQGHTAMRISVSSWATTDADVERSLDAMVRCARRVIA